MMIHHSRASGLFARSSRPLRAIGATAFAGATIVGLIGAGSISAAAAPVTFATQVGGTYDGMPVFDGKPVHLDDYINTLLNYVDINTVARWANGQRGDFTIPTGPHTGKVVPGMELFGEGLQGVSTDFPADVAMGQTWNSSLVGQEGEVIGNEALYKQNFQNSISTFNAMVSAGQSDIRINPLAGRLDEGYGEDPALASAFVNELSTGVSGIDDPANDDGFWTKMMVNNKHYTNYLSEWFRRGASNDVDNRATMEYYSYPANDAIKNGSVGSIITSYGRTNAIPNALSPIIDYAQTQSRWGANGGLYTVPDNGSDTQLSVVNKFSNGFDTNYTPSQAQAASLMQVAEQGSIAVNTAAQSPLNDSLIAGIANGTYGVTRDEVYQVASAQLVPLVREGLFNERDSSGLPKYYPFVGLSAASPTPINSTVAANQAVAEQAAEQSLVLLKNDNNVLPLSTNAQVNITGPLSDARFRTTYAGTTPTLPNAGLTPQQGIKAEYGANVTNNETDGAVIDLKSVSNGKYLALDSSATPGVVANGTNQSDASTFESFDWGQGAVGLRSTATSKWLQFASNAVNVGGAQVFGTKATTLPYQIRPQYNADGTVSLIVGSYSSSFTGGFETAYWTAGRYLTVDPTTGQIGVTGVLTNAANAATLNTDATKFTMDTVAQTGSQAVAQSNGTNYAVVVVGEPARNSAGEGADRSSLDLGADQYKLIKNVAKAYPKRTIVVVSSSVPVALDQVQKNANVAAIIEAPDGGQYGNYALGKLLSGAIAPTGRLTNTWYASTSALPAISSYSIPEGENAIRGINGIDPRFTVDMSEGSAAQTGLTYMYTNAPVTYPFGYGLSYSQFDYSNLRINENSSSKYTAYVDVKNSGTVDTSETVQLYASNPSSAYGDAAPKRKLVGFTKVAIPAGTTKTVAVPISTDNLALWDTVKGKMDVEAGNYRFEAGASSDDIRLTQTFPVAGQQLSTVDAQTAPVSVFDQSFDASNVTYREASKANTVEGLKADDLDHGYSVVMSKSPGAWTALHGVDFTGAGQVTLSVASQNASSTLELHVDSPTGPAVATATFGATGSTSYNIPGATSDGNIPVQETAFKNVTAELSSSVTGKHDLYVVFQSADTRVNDLQLTAAPASTSTPTPTPTPTDTATPTIVLTGGTGLSGTSVRVGDKLTADAPTSSVAGTTFTYQWLRSGVPIAGAIASSYTVGAADYKKQLSVTVLASATGYTSATSTSGKTTAVKTGLIDVTKKAAIKGTAKVGKKLSVVKPKVSVSSPALSYRWLRAGKAITGATHSTYTVKKADRGHHLSVKVTIKKSGYTSATSTSASSRIVK